MISPALRVAPLAPWLHQAWDAYVDRHPGGWLWHRAGWIGYQLAYSRDSLDASFAVLDERHAVVAVVPAVVHRPRDPAPPELSYSGDPLAAPLLDDSDLRGVVDHRLYAIARERGAGTMRVADQPFSGAPASSDAASHRVVEIDGAGRPPWVEVRKSYHSLINAGLREYAIHPRWGDNDPAYDAFAAYLRLHRAQFKDRPPRPDATYRLQRQWLAEGRAMVAVAEDPGVQWGAAYWFVYKDCAYYGSGVYLANDVAHAVVWKSLLGLKEMGVKRVSMGWQGVARTEKGKRIEFFKRGFGGGDVPVDRRVVTL